MITNGIFNVGAGVLGLCILLHAGTEVPLDISSPVVLSDTSVRKVVIFDIGGILATYSTSRIGMTIFKDSAREIGFFKILKYVASRKNCTHHLRSLVFKVLEEIGSLHPLNPQEYVAIQTYDEEGNLHPKGICLLNAGYLSSTEFMQYALHIIATWWEQDQHYCKDQRVHFTSTVEVALVRNTIMRMGNGELMSKIFKPIKEGVALFEQMVETPGVEVMVLSNYPTDQFDQLVKGSFLNTLFQKIPQNHIFCSGQLLPACSRHCLAARLLKPKPHPAAFAEMILYCQAMYGVRPQDIIFLDNQEENIRAAAAQGIDARLVNSVNKQSELPRYTFAEIERQLSGEVSASYV